MRAAPAPATSIGSTCPSPSEPVHREGPTDLRLVCPALSVWAAAAWALEAPTPWILAGVGACTTAGATVLHLHGRSRSHAGPRHLERQAKGTAIAAALLCAAAGAGVAGLHAAEVRRGPVPELARQHAQITAVLEVTADARRARSGGGSTTFVLPAEVIVVARPGAAAGTATRAPVLLIARHPEWSRLLPSTHVRITGRLAPAEAGGPVAAVLRVPASDQPEVTDAPNLVQRLAGRLRAGLLEASKDLPPDARALLPGLVVGDTSRVPPDLFEAFLATDLLHLLAVSGSNLTIVLTVLLGPPGRAMRAERRGLARWFGLSLRGTALCGGALTLAFVIVCRPEPSVLRAAACGAVALLAIGTGRRRSLVPALASAALLLVLYDPWLSRSYGFVLSVLATAALLVLAPRWSDALHRRGLAPRWADALAAALAAQAVCAPVVAMFAARVSLVAVPCNLLAEFAAGPATVLGFASLAVAPVAMPVAELLARGAGLPASWIAGVARVGADLPGAGIDWPGGALGGFLLALLAVVALTSARRLAHHPWSAATLAVLLLLAVLRPEPLSRSVLGWPPAQWRYAQCDVGQGDAAVIAVGPGTAVVVDAGPDPVLVDRCLRALGVIRVPLLLLTHFHADHVAGLGGVLRNRSVGLIQTAVLEEPQAQAALVRRTATAAQVPVRPARPGERRRIGALDWQVLWPPPAVGPVPQPTTANDASVTLLVRTAGLQLLLLGDLEPGGQQGLLRAHPELGRVDVLKVAHHGSAHQEPALLERLRPRVAVIPVGAGNPYGHPAASTLAALKASGTRVLRTDTDGAIALSGRGRALFALTRHQ
ncbi:ComEC/Rec2 family competence protein [Streptomyces sp. NPDC006879]|uniref:ComEC/Rec2 family competence protein n=1 Tax=Streptomyces sp. NPDC006879 TaxID=3364767 RepID=UPI0036CE6739